MRLDIGKLKTPRCVSRIVDEFSGAAGGVGGLRVFGVPLSVSTCENQSAKGSRHRNPARLGRRRNGLGVSWRSADATRPNDPRRQTSLRDPRANFTIRVNASPRHPREIGRYMSFSPQRRAQAKRAQVIAHDHLAEAKGRKVPCRSKRADIAA